jgi:quercetin dioxygenase-like cupin family protein
MKCLALTLAVSVTWASYSVAAGDLCSVAPANCKVLKEDAKVRVLEFTAKKGDRTPMHAHPAYVVYIVKAGVSRFTLPDGTSFVRNPKNGEAFINPPVEHSEECLEDQIAILVELKQ